MKAVALLLIPAIALAGWYERDGQWVESAVDAPWQSKGYVARTQAEYDAAHRRPTPGEIAAAQSNAAAQASMPTPMPNGVAVQDAASHWCEIVPVANSTDVIAVQISNSPLDPATRKAMKDAAMAAHYAAQGAKAVRRTNDLAQARSAKANAAAANSVPALRAEVKRLSEIIERLLQE